MCLAIEGKIIFIEDLLARVDFGGVLREARADLAPNAKVGDYVLVHAGYVIQILDEEWMKSKQKYNAWAQSQP